MFDWLFGKRCKHIWKTTSTTFLYSEECLVNCGGCIEMEYYDNYCIEQKCMRCNEERKFQVNKHVPKPRKNPL